MSHTDVATFNGWTIRQLHSPDRTRLFGVSIMPENYDGRDVSKIVSCHDLAKARILCGDPEYKFIKVDTNVFKVIGYVDGVGEYPAGYASRPTGVINPPTDQLHMTLAEARKAVGANYMPIASTPTKPRSAYPQNAKGYKANNAANRR